METSETKGGKSKTIYNIYIYIYIYIYISVVVGSNPTQANFL